MLLPAVVAVALRRPVTGFPVLPPVLTSPRLAPVLPAGSPPTITALAVPAAPPIVATLAPVRAIPPGPRIAVPPVRTVGALRRSGGRDVAVSTARIVPRVPPLPALGIERPVSGTVVIAAGSPLAVAPITRLAVIPSGPLPVGIPVAPALLTAPGTPVVSVPLACTAVVTCASLGRRAASIRSWVPAAALGPVVAIPARPALPIITRTAVISTRRASPIVAVALVAAASVAAVVLTTVGTRLPGPVIVPGPAASRRTVGGSTAPPRGRTRFPRTRPPGRRTVITRAATTLVRRSTGPAIDIAGTFAGRRPGFVAGPGASDLRSTVRGTAL